MKVSSQVTAPVPIAFPGGVFPAGCPSRVVLDHVTSKWGVLVLRRPVGAHAALERAAPPRRGRQREDARPDAADPRTRRLRAPRRQPVIPPRVDYSLTDRGRELVALLIPLVTWIAGHAAEIVAPPTPQTVPLGRNAGMREPGP